ncbi:MAG: alpha/beta fold hydrolase [Chloroflexi bacterium]|nr:alpha/beta fold hydrolase [Chloroflexota bacterium]
MVLLHNFLGSGETTWRPQIPVWARHYKLIVPDLRGHGRSDNPAGIIDYRLLVDDVLTLLDHLGIARAMFVGVSAGAMLQLLMAVEHPDRVERMVWTDTTYYFLPEVEPLLRREIALMHSRPGLLSWMQRIHGQVYGPDYWQQLAQLWIDLIHKPADCLFPASPRLAEINFPVLVIHGDRDHFFPPRIALEIYERLRQGQLWIVPSAGHFPNQEYSGWYNQVVLEFLQKQPD